MRTAFFLIPVVIFAIGLSACGSRGEDIAKELCDCHESANADFGKKAQCVTRQAELQKQLEGDAQETVKYLQKL